MEANGEPNAELTRADFLVAVLKSYGIVDEEVLRDIDERYEKLVNIDLVGVDLVPNGSGEPRPDQPRLSQSASSGGEGATSSVREATLSCRVVYSHLVRQQRVVHSGSEASQQRPRAAAVDMNTPDQGFSEWYTRYWLPKVSNGWRGLSSSPSGSAYSPLRDEPAMTRVELAELRHHATVRRLNGGVTPEGSFSRNTRDRDLADPQPLPLPNPKTADDYDNPMAC